MDLNIISPEGKLLSTIEELRPFGEYWESLNEYNVWGGKWTHRPDSDHFQMSDETRKSIPRPKGRSLLCRIVKVFSSPRSSKGAPKPGLKMKTYLILSTVLLFTLEGMAMQRRPSNAKDVPQEPQETPSRHHQQQEMLTRHQELLVGYGETFIL